MEILIKNLDEEKKRFSEQMKSERIAQEEQIENMMNANMKQAQEDRMVFIEENEALKDNLREIQKSNEENAKLIKQLSDLAAEKEEEMRKLREDMQRKAEDGEAEIQRLNSKHDKEMRAIRENMEKEKVKTGCGGRGLTARATTARKRDEKIRQTYEDQEEVEKPGFFQKALEFVGHIAPAVGAVVSAVAPTLAPIAGAVATGVTAVAEFCSIM